MEPKKTDSIYGYRDDLVKQLPDRLSLTGQLSPEQRMAKLMSLGTKAVFKNYCVGELTNLNTPNLIINGERPMVQLFGNILGPRFGVEALKFGIDNALPIEGSDSQKTEQQYMLAYPHCEKSDFIAGGGVSDRAKQVGVKEITFMTITSKQMDVLRKLVAPPKPVASSILAPKA